MSLWKKENDIFYLKLKEVEKLLKDNIGLLTRNRIIGISPPTIRNNGYSTITRYRGV